MKFKPINVPSASSLFVEQLKKAILTGEYQPGEKLPSERELEKQLHVSRPVINNGLKKLAMMHFIDIKPRHGAFIADYRTEGDLITMNEIINFHGGHYRIPLLNSIYRVRFQIELDIIRLATRNQNEQALQKAHFILQAIPNRDTDAQQAHDYFDFIHQLALASENDVYPLLINNFKPIYLTLGKWIYESIDPSSLRDENQQLLNSIKEGQEEKAIELERKLIANSYFLLTGERQIDLQ
ncbi:MAG: FadR/GntR family transcriptional regulator [Limosilactobacillus sp.]